MKYKQNQKGESDPSMIPIFIIIGLFIALTISTGWLILKILSIIILIGIAIQFLAILLGSIIIDISTFILSIIICIPVIALCCYGLKYFWFN